MNNLQTLKDKLPKTNNQPTVIWLLNEILEQLIILNKNRTEYADNTATPEEEKKEQQPTGRKGRGQGAKAATVPHNEVEKVQGSALD